jgi:hypothetical protein
VICQRDLGYGGVSPNGELLLPARLGRSQVRIAVAMFFTFPRGRPLECQAAGRGVRGRDRRLPLAWSGSHGACCGGYSGVVTPKRCVEASSGPGSRASWREAAAAPVDRGRECRDQAGFARRGVDADKGSRGETKRAVCLKGISGLSAFCDLNYRLKSGRPFLLLPRHGDKNRELCVDLNHDA